jgi:hypothetical protein
MDTLHLAWSAPLLLVVGAAALERLRFALAVLSIAVLVALSAPAIAARVAALRQPRLEFADGLEIPAQTATELRGLVADIQNRTGPGEPIFVYPSSPLIYVLAQRPNPTRFDHVNPGAADATQIAQLIADLESSQTSIVVRSDFWERAWGPPGANAALVSWLDAHFTEVARYGTYRVVAADL